MWRCSESDSVHSHKRDQASSREKGNDMAVTLARPPAQPPEPPNRPARRRLMEKFVIEGGAPLSATVVPAGNQHAALPVLAASVLTEDEVVVENVPRIRDVDAMLGILEEVGVRVERFDHGVRLCAAGVGTTEIDRDLSERIRASFLLAGPLLARFGRAHMPPPGGDVIGRRRLDPHLDAFRALGATVKHGLDIELEAPAAGLKNCDFL